MAILLAVSFAILVKLYLEATRERCSLKYVSFKTTENRYTEYEYITMIEKINIII